MERRCIQTNIGNLNRDIKEANQMLSAIRKTIRGLLDWMEDLIQLEKELLKEESASTDLGVLLNDYLNQRKAERSDWSWSSQQKGDIKDLKDVARAVVYHHDGILYFSCKKPRRPLCFIPIENHGRSINPYLTYSQRHPILYQGGCRRLLLSFVLGFRQAPESYIRNSTIIYICGVLNTY